MSDKHCWMVTNSGASPVVGDFYERLPDADHIIRLQFFGDQVVGQSAPTELLRQRLLNLRRYQERVASYLGDALDAMKQGRDYDGHYIAHLLGELDEDEFEQLSLEFLQVDRPVEMSELTERLAAILANTNAEFSIAEMAELLSCPEDAVKLAVDAIALPQTSSSGT